jgi:protein tyrosine/serine phosphatase
MAATDSNKADTFPTSIPSPVLPFDRSYWVIPGRLLMGYVPVKPEPSRTREKVRELLEQGIRTFINLMYDNETNYDGVPIPGYEQELQAEAQAMGVMAQHHRLSIEDLTAPTAEHMKQVLDQIDESLNAGLPVYVHCWGGRGRTGTVAGCYLARHGYASGQRALDFVQHLRRTDAKAHTASPETQEQRTMVREWLIGA